MSDSLFSIREAREEDLPYVNSYAYNEGMDAIPGLELLWVAVNDDDVPVGFIRLSNIDGDVAYINPIVTLASWRGFGVGKALVEFAHGLYPELRLVSRGTSHAFYEALGYRDCAWEDIVPEVANECDGCPMYDECGPRPMVKRV